MLKEQAGSVGAKRKAPEADRATKSVRRRVGKEGLVEGTTEASVRKAPAVTSVGGGSSKRAVAEDVAETGAEPASESDESEESEESEEEL